MDVKGITKQGDAIFLFIATTQADALLGTNSTIRITMIFFFIENELLSL
ncbi:phage holin family protein [Bacillus thuringiensis]